jgi:hypothetical protein
MTQEEFTGQKPVCDIVLKGGITSDMVYPLAVVELAKKYRFGSIGGTSSGALSAAITAAAEYARGTGGFRRVAAIPDETADSLFDQFQPEPQLRPLFDMLMAGLGTKSSIAKAPTVISAAVLGYPGATLAGVWPGLLIFGFALDPVSYGWLLFGLLLAVIGGTVCLAARVVRAVTKELPAANFGLCSGRTVPGCSGQGITDWLADTIDRVAGKLNADGQPASPLTFGDLESLKRDPPIELAMITTDLAMKRPYRLPFQDGTHLFGEDAHLFGAGAHFFSKADFKKLFPDRVVEHICSDKMLLKTAHGPNDGPHDLYQFPEKKDLPIVVAARLSLSFPFLIQAVPLYKRDLTLRHGRDQLRKCLFGDGGLSSNFPIHLFDRLWPNSPTFAISLDDFSKERNVDNGKEIRVDMASDPLEGEYLPIVPISGIGGFILRLLDAAKDWQDNLQSVLPGYRERIVHVYLKPGEGGLNLAMPPGVIQKLTELGKEAGNLPVREFDMDKHRWRRFLVAMAEIEQMLDELAQSYDHSSVRGGSFGAFLARYKFDRTAQPASEAWKQETLRRAEELVAVGRRWRTQPTVRSGRIPKPGCDLHIVPKQ